MGGWWWSEDKEGTYERGYMCEYVTSSKLRRDRSDDVSNVRVVSSMLTQSRCSYGSLEIRVTGLIIEPYPF